MLKESDFYSILTQDTHPVWKGSWPETFRNLYSVNGYTSENLAIFLSPDSLKRHLQLLDNNEKIKVIQTLFESCERKACNIYSDQNDPSSLELLLKLIDLQKLYDKIIIENNIKGYISPLVFGKPLSDINYTKILINRFGYETLSVLADKLNFTPSLIMQIARGLDKDKTTDITGREKLVNILKEKYNDVLPLYDWLSSEEETRKHFGVYEKYHENFIVEDDEGKEVNAFYNESPYPMFLTRKQIMGDIAKNMGPPEYADFVLSLIRTNTSDNPIITFPHYSESNLPQEISFELFARLIKDDPSFGKPLTDFFLDNIYNQKLKELFEKYPIKSYYDMTPYYKIYAAIPEDDKESQFCVVLYQLLKTILSSQIVVEDYRLFIKESMDNDFNWIDLEYNPQIAINGFGSNKQLFDFFSKHPELTERCVEEFDGKNKIINDFLEKTNEEVIEEKDIYQKAIDSGAIIIQKIPDSILNFFMEEAKKLGLDKVETVNYLNTIIVYDIYYNKWKQVCKKMNKKDCNFLGIDLSKVDGVFLPKGITHELNISPIIIKKPDYSINKPIDRLFENLGISSYLVKEKIILAHEGAHALHYLADPQFIGKGGQYGVHNEDIGNYLGNVLENIAYAHGTLPFFKQLIMDNISKVVHSPIFQKAILSWIISNILSSEDAPLQGIYNSKEIMRQAIVLNEKYGTSIQEYVKKKKDRQISKIYELTVKNQFENKMEILKDILQREREIKKLLKSERYPAKILKLKNELESLGTRKLSLSKNLLDIDLDDAAEALTESYIREYFLSFLEDQNLPEQDLQEQVKFIMNATFGGTGEYRPLTTEILPIVTTPIDRSGGYYPHLIQDPYDEGDLPDEKEASVIKRLIKISNKIDNKHTDIADKIDKLIKLY